MTTPDLEAIAERIGVRRPWLERFIELCKEPASQWGMADSDVVAICKCAQALEAHIRTLTAENERLREVVKKFEDFADHKHFCKRTLGVSSICDCGLAEIEIRARAALKGEET